MEKVTGIGGIFLDADDPERLRWWYEKHLGITPAAISPDDPTWCQEAGPTHITFSLRSKEHAENRSKDFQMTTFRVRDLDRMVAQLRAAGIEIRIRKHDHGPQGKTASFFDPERNAVQLWEPRGSRNIAVRPASLADIPLLADMMGESYLEARAPLDRVQAGAGFAGLLSSPSHGAAWIVNDEGEPAGYAVLTMRFSARHGGMETFIDDLFVHPAHRRRGLARAVLKEVFAECQRRGASSLQVEVEENNDAMKALFAGYNLVPQRSERELLTILFNTQAPSRVAEPEHQRANTKTPRAKHGRTSRGL